MYNYIIIINIPVFATTVSTLGCGLTVDGSGPSN